VDEYLSEKEQIDRIRTWWKENGWYLIGGVILGLAGLFGYGRYEQYNDSQAETAQALFEQVVAAAEDDDLTALDGILGQLRDAHADSPYTDHAALLVARLVLVRDSDRASEELRYVMETTADEELSMIARMRLARVLAYREQYVEALDTLEMAELGQFAGRVSDIRGDIYLEQGDRDAARLAFASALAAPGAELLDREFVQMKLSELLASAEASMPVTPSEPTETITPATSGESTETTAPVEPVAPAAAAETSEPTGLAAPGEDE